MLPPLPPPPAEWGNWAQIIGPLLTAFAVIAAWISAGASRRSAKASLKTADRADETSRRAIEALARTIRPDFRCGIQGPDRRERQPQPAQLSIENLSPHPGLIISIKVRSQHRDHINIEKVVNTHIDGRTDVGLPEVTVGLGNVARANPTVQVADLTDDLVNLIDKIDWTLEYTDDNRLVTWTQSGTISEYVTRAGGDHLNFVYGSVTATDGPRPPQLITASPAPTSKPSWYSRLCDWAKR